MDYFTSSSLSPYYNIIFSALAFLLSTLIFISSRKSKSKNLNLPPGPPGWPVVGNLFQVASSGKPFFRYIRENLIPNYGPILTMKMGTSTMIIISDADLVHEALNEKGKLYASRPKENPTRIVFSCNKFTVNAATYGPVWRSLRRNMVQNALSQTKFREYRTSREVAMDLLIQRLKTEAMQNDGVVWVLKNARFAFFSILCSMCFGVEMDEKMIEKVDQMMKTVLLVLNPRIDDFLPILSPFFYKERKRAMEVRNQQIETLLPLIERRKRAIENPGSDKTAASFSYLDTLFDLKIEGRKSSPTIPEIVTLCSEILNGGTDTTGTAIEWAIARLIDNPHVQRRVFEEIKTTVGDKRVEEKDLEKMPYLNAVVKELLRRHPPTHISLPHAVTEPTKLAGYDIPMDAIVEIFLPGISMDPKIWTDPEKFDPDRFFSSQDEVDITGLRGVKSIPFGAGRRICPGLQMAMVHVSLMLARMVQEFEWFAYPENSKVEFGEKLEFTVVMKNTLRAKIRPRN
ncbi:hypothetical protein Leryth_008289 [Lithospermum erythrorhizon]|uniref:Oxygenase n=1 Tax=Lithospermum erythrorhizon TaxID=34254 RepID=A0AAV3RU93_LITER|nr:hypothetical protein Leryth_008289 [Lithospermum erythrorhizon]